MIHELNESRTNCMSHGTCSLCITSIHMCIWVMKNLYESRTIQVTNWLCESRQLLRMQRKYIHINMSHELIRRNNFMGHSMYCNCIASLYLYKSVYIHMSHELIRQNNYMSHGIYLICIASQHFHKSAVKSHGLIRESRTHTSKQIYESPYLFYLPLRSASLQIRIYTFKSRTHTSKRIHESPYLFYLHRTSASLQIQTYTCESRTHT